jgi:phosphate:Na+ symporter
MSASAVRTFIVAIFHQSHFPQGSPQNRPTVVTSAFSGPWAWSSAVRYLVCRRELLLFKPLSVVPAFHEWLVRSETPWLGVLIGMVFTALVQSSSVTTGLAILLVQQGLLPAAAAIPIVMGANIGTTSTGIIASLGMRPIARATATANLLFNIGGVLIFFPFLRPFSRFMVDWFRAGGMSVAWAHLIFNVTVALVFGPLLDQIEPRISAEFRLPPKLQRATEN